MRILLVGDIHGRWQELNEHLTLVKSMFRINCAVQVGDFGLFEKNFKGAVESKFRFAVPLHVIDGNHEDHEWLAWAYRAGLAEQWPWLFNLFYHPRATLFDLYGTKIGVLGGALHVDQPQQITASGVITNFIQPAQVQAALQLFNIERPDIIATHSCPAAIGIGLESSQQFAQGIIENIVSAGYTASPIDDCGEVELQNLWAGLHYRPKMWIFGHFHRSHSITIDTTQFVCLPGFSLSQDQVLDIWDTEERCLYQLRWQ